MTLALVSIFNAVTAAFAADAADASVDPVPNVFGWRTPTYNAKATAGRVCWVPGDPQGDAGQIGPAVRQGRTPERPLATLGEQFTVYVYGATLGAAELTSEILQYTAARELFDYFYRSLYNAARTIGSGNRFALVKLVWIIDKTERPHGACLRALFTIESAIVDQPINIAPVNTTAALDTGIAAVSGGAITTDDGEVDIAPDPSIP